MNATRGRFLAARSGRVVRPTRRRGPLAATLLAGLVLAAPAWALGGGKSHTPQVRVVGQASVSAAPDRVSVDVGVATRSESAREAAERNAEETNAVVKALREAFPDAVELSTSGYTLAPEYEYDKREGRRRPAGFSARNTVRIVLANVGAAGPLIDAAVAAGANEVRDVRFSVAESSDLQRRALVAAAADARAKAEVLAESVGAKLGRTLRVEEQGATPMPTGRVRAAFAQAEATPIEPSDVYFESTVAIWVELSDR